MKKKERFFMSVRKLKIIVFNWFYFVYFNINRRNLQTNRKKILKITLLVVLARQSDDNNNIIFLLFLWFLTDCWGFELSWVKFVGFLWAWFYCLIWVSEETVKILFDWLGWSEIKIVDGVLQKNVILNLSIINIRKKLKIVNK